jgi:hypothetical protein
LRWSGGTAPGVKLHAPAHRRSCCLLTAAAAACGPTVERNVIHSAAQNVEAKLRLADAYAPSTPSAARDTLLLSRASAANARVAAATTTASAAPATLPPLPSCTGVQLTARMWRPWFVALHVVCVMVAATFVQGFVRLRSVCCITRETWACCRTTHWQ